MLSGIECLGFDKMPHTYIITFNSDYIENRKTKMFRQNPSLFGLIAHLPERNDLNNTNLNTTFNILLVLAGVTLLLFIM